MTKTLQRRTLDLATITLEKGAHNPDHTFCVMEAVAFIAGEPWSDAPQCGGVFSPFTPRCMNCYGAVPTITTYGTAPQSCPGCGKTPCDHSTTGCPMPPRPSVTV